MRLLFFDQRLSDDAFNLIIFTDARYVRKKKKEDIYLQSQKIHKYNNVHQTNKSKQITQQK